MTNRHPSNITLTGQKRAEACQGAFEAARAAATATELPKHVRHAVHATFEMATDAIIGGADPSATLTQIDDLLTGLLGESRADEVRPYLDTADDDLFRALRR